MREGLEAVTTVDVRCELFDAGFHPEDGPGLPYGSNNHTGEAFFIIAETPNGFRFQSSEVFSDGLHLASFHEEDGDFQAFVKDDPKAGDHANDLADYIQAFINKGGKLDPKFWTPIQGCYGSAGWDEQEEIDLEAREREEESWGWR